VENRIAGADANPYLAIAATLAAGLAGMDEKLRPTEPITGNGYDHAHDLARTFLAAHELMAKSRSAPRLLGPELVQAYLSVKGLEYDSFQREISAWERRFLVPQA
jgi:glutamine synthetase